MVLYKEAIMGKDKRATKRDLKKKWIEENILESHGIHRKLKLLERKRSWVDTYKSN